MTQLQIDLTAMQTLLTSSWTPAVSRTNAGAAVEPIDPTAATWDLIGACWKAASLGAATPVEMHTRARALVVALHAQLPDPRNDSLVAYDSVAGRRAVDVTALISGAATVAATAAVPRKP